MPRRRTILIASLAVIAVGALLAWAFAPRPVQVEVAEAARGRYVDGVVEEGRTRVRDRYVIAAPLSGQLARITLREGDVVTHGMTLASLTPTLPPMLDARTDAGLAARIEGAEAELARAEAAVRTARVQVEAARRTLARDEPLLRERYVSARQVEDERLALRAAERVLAEAEQARHVADHGVAQARAAREVAGSEAGREAVFEVDAPIDGRVLRVVQASAGPVAMGAPLLELGDTAALEVVAELLTTDAPRAKRGTPVEIAGWGGPALRGHVLRVEPAAFTKVSALGVEEQRVRAVIAFDTPPPADALGDGFRVEVRIVDTVREDVLRVPVGAVFPAPGAEAAGTAMAVFVVRDGRARLVRVTVGGRNGREAWITGGLSPGDVVVLYPGDALRDDVRVAVRTVAVRGPGR